MPGIRANNMWVAAKYPDKVQSLSLHSSWPKTDAFLRTIVEGWQVMANALGVPEMIIRAIFPWCFTPELYADRPHYIESLAGFVRSRPAQSVADFIQQSNAVHGVNQMNQRKSGFDLVTLQVADLMPTDRRSALGQLGGFPPQLLRPAFAQIENS